LPLVTGSCARYRYDTNAGHCVKFRNGDCGANANHFETLKECEARCGGSAVSHCPETIPDSEQCVAALACDYELNGCLCTPHADQGHCHQIDPTCVWGWAAPSELPACDGPDCPLPIVLQMRTVETCTCYDGIWFCDLRTVP
jgi:hypothetical protein